MKDLSKDELQKFVRQFLDELKTLIWQDGLYVAERQTNKATLVDLGLTGKQREEIVLSLSVMDYCSGPIKDEYKPGDYWVFGKQIDSVEIYIKLKIAGQSGNEHAVCLSFHKSERPLSYPFTI
jgi:hypothetical protein